MNIIVRIVAGVLQDDSPASDPYKKVTPVYVALSVMSVFVSLIMVTIYFTTKYSSNTFISNMHVDIGKLQWTRKQRIANGDMIKRRKRVVGLGDDESVDGVNEGTVGEQRERKVMAAFSLGAFGALVLLVMGGWAAYFWGVATGHNS